MKNLRRFPKCAMKTKRRTYNRLPAFRWNFPAATEPAKIRELCAKTGVSRQIASILLRRHGGNPSRAESFMAKPGEELLELLARVPELPQAVKRLVSARDAGEKVAVYSDFDADGVTGAVILNEAFQAAGIHSSVYLPHRQKEGYGFHAKSIKALVSSGVSLFVTADLGIAGHEGCSKARDLGADVIVTDHHLLPEKLPETLVILDPHLSSWSHLNLGYLSGAGVAYLLAIALLKNAGDYGKMPPRWGHDLLALSIAGDGQPLLGWNREWATSGLCLMRKAPRPGIAALAQVAGLHRFKEDGSSPSFDSDVTYGLVPRINAAGRMDDALLAYRLLTETNPQIALDLAGEIEEHNLRRKTVEMDILTRCKELVLPEKYALCAFHEDWHQGVIGIVCSRLREMHQRPVVLAAGEKGLLKGSVRGVPGFHAHRALSRCAGLLQSFGGHEGAAGFSVKKADAAALFDEMQKMAEEMLTSTSLVPSLDIDYVAELGTVSSQDLQSFFSLEPYGCENTPPVLASVDCEIEQVRFMGKTGNHLQIMAKKNGVRRRFIWFGGGGFGKDIALWGRADLAFVPFRSLYLGREEFAPLIRDIRPAGKLAGEFYCPFARNIPQGRPVVVYTWSDAAAKALLSALEKIGRPAAFHSHELVGAFAHEAKLTLRDPGGVVVSTSPWSLPVETLSTPGSGGPFPFLLVMHPPAAPKDLARLKEVADSAGSGLLYSEGEADSIRWRDWTFPSKERVESLWNYLMAEFSGNRAPLCDLGRRWKQILALCDPVHEGKPCWEGAQQAIVSGAQVLEELGLAEYDESRRMPELILNPKAGRTSLSDSRLFLRGKAIRDKWLEPRPRGFLSQFSLWGDGSWRRI